jgi:hypothetical protein
MKESGRHRASMDELEGRWRVERLSGALPPMVAVHKKIHGKRGETRFGHFLALPFRIEQREDCPALVYRLSFSTLVDEVRKQTEDSWLGETILGGRALGRFRMTRVS